MLALLIFKSLHHHYIYLSMILVLSIVVSLYEILSLHCSLLNLQRSLEALKLYTATESYLLCVSGVSCHGEKIPFEVWPPSFTLTIMLLALSCPPCKAHVFSFVRLPLPLSCTPPGFPLLCHSLSHCYPFTVRRSGPNLIPPGHAGKCSWSLGWGIGGLVIGTLLISASWNSSMVQCWLGFIW